MSIKDVENDIRSGDFGMAKKRLCSYVMCTGYDPDVCSRIGDICVEMKDLREAGRWYFIGSRSTPVIESLVDRFTQDYRGTYSNVLKHLPMSAKRVRLHDYPDFVQERIKRIPRYNLKVREIAAQLDPNPRQSRSKRRQERLAIGMILMILSFLAVCAAVGILTLAGWISKLV